MKRESPMKSKRQPAKLHCPFCEFVVDDEWFLRERLERLASHLIHNHFDLAICCFCHRRPNYWDLHLRFGCSTGFGKEYRYYNYRYIIAAWHAQLLGINPEKETAK